MVVTLPYWMARVQLGHCRSLLIGIQWPDEGRRGNQVVVFSSYPSFASRKPLTPVA